MDERAPGQWINHGTIREVYDSWWVRVTIDDVERPDGSRVEHEVIRGLDACGMVVLHPDRGVLMIYRHRFMPDTWGWEIPAGAMDDGEEPIETARRECLEETGWRVVGDVRLLSTHHPSCGLINQTFQVFLATDAVFVGDPSDVNEAARVEWRSIADVAADVRSGRICDGFSQLAVVYALAAMGSGGLLEPAGDAPIEDAS